jgi:hypothetical protein
MGRPLQESVLPIDSHAFPPGCGGLRFEENYFERNVNMPKKFAAKAAPKPMKIAKQLINKEMNDHLKSDFGLGVAV